MQNLDFLQLNIIPIHKHISYRMFFHNFHQKPGRNKRFCTIFKFHKTFDINYRYQRLLGITNFRTL